MDDASKLAYQFALELTKQLITLSTVIIGLSVTFTKDVLKQAPSSLARVTLAGSWLCYIGSMWYGVSHIQSLTGSLEMAAIERVADVDSLTRRQSRLARIYLDTVSADSTSNLARSQLAATGLMVGDSAKPVAKRQVDLFFFGTGLIVLYGALTLVPRRISPTVKTLFWD